MPMCESTCASVAPTATCGARSTGAEMAIGGTFREIVPPQKLVITEKFDDAWYTQARR